MRTLLSVDPPPLLRYLLGTIVLVIGVILPLAYAMLKKPSSLLIKRGI
jgi:hypothetical protein